MTTPKTALVLGATGGIGGEMAAVLLRRGWAVRALSRNPPRIGDMAPRDNPGLPRDLAGPDDPALSVDPQVPDQVQLPGDPARAGTRTLPGKAPAHLDPTRPVTAAEATRNAALNGVTWIAGDAMRPADVAAAAHGATLIVHAVNPPGYRRWNTLVQPMLESSIRAAQATGARILLPGTIYNYGPDAFPVLTEASPQHPHTRKGGIRAAMERRLQASGLPVLILRAGDYFGPRAANNWFSQALVQPGHPVRRIFSPGRPGVGHAWAYLPDVAEAMMRLVERDAAPGGFETFHFAGHWDPDGTAMAAAIRRAVGEPAPRLWHLPWALVAAVTPFVPLAREIWEMRYTWHEPLRLDNTRLRTTLGAEPQTPLDAAVRATLAGLGCLDAASVRDGAPADRSLPLAAGR